MTDHLTPALSPCGGEGGSWGGVAWEGGFWLDSGMKDTLAEDLERLKGLAFGKVAERRKLVEGFNGLGEARRSRG